MPVDRTQPFVSIHATGPTGESLVVEYTLKDFFNRMMPDLCGRIVKNFEENMLGVLWSYLQNYIGHGAKVTFDGTDGETKLNKYQNQQAELKERLSLLKGELFHEEQKPRWIKIEEST